jgi:hypothetical protein
MPINLNKLKQQDELHICDAYRADLQTVVNTNVISLSLKMSNQGFTFTGVLCNIAIVGTIWCKI